MGVKADYRNRFGGSLGYYDAQTFETLDVLKPVKFVDDFLGYQLALAESGNQARWATVATNLNTSPGLVADEPNGVVQITVDSDDNAEQGVLYWGDNTSLDLSKGLIFETRLTFETLPTTGTETVAAVFGLADDTGATLDDIATNLWFRVESSAQTALLIEGDDGNTDTDDQDASTTLAAGTYNIFRIDCSDTTDVRFYVDGTYVGSIALADLTAAEAKVQPYFSVQKAVSSANTGTGTMYIDYVKVWQDRS